MNRLQLLALSGLLCAAQAAATPIHEAPTREIDRRTKQNMFNTERRLTSVGLSEAELMNGATMGGTYESHFGEPFMQDVKALTPGRTWVDMGTGKGLALTDALRTHTFNAIGVGYLHPNRELLAKNLKEYSTFRYVEGDVFQHELDKLGGRGQVDLITDLYGVAYYSPAYMENVVRLYGELLRPGGRVYLTHMFGANNSSRFNLQAADGTRVHHLSFFKNIEGMRVVRDVPESAGHSAHIVLERTGDTLRVPELRRLYDDRELQLVDAVQTTPLSER